MKYLVLLAVLVLVYAALRPSRASRQARSDRHAAPRLDKPQDMVACARCGVHLPRSDAMTDARGRTYCCQEHRDRGPA
ncbi:hypothetical protein GCM10022279_09250 [Comamonas faecalis]|uniref:Deaminase n=1 Tax=Comamonas faecalis TaxID=1387849 RepID=A0ABP7QUP5_9BURK